MGRLRRSALETGLAGAFLLAGSALWLAGESAPVIQLRTPAPPGSLTIENRGAGAVELARKIAVEMRRGDTWAPVDTEFDAVAECAAPSNAGACVRLAGKSTLRAVAWRGFSCSGQCASICRANLYYGPGTFRFVVSTCDRKKQYRSEPFQMPASPR